jgi:N-acetylmuramoyl-L-alanine amidase CwlA
MTLTITKVNLPQAKYYLKCPFAMDADGITMHNTANDASAMAEISYMQGNGYEVSFHYAVDDTRAVQGLPLNRNGWHAGDGGKGKGNRNTIGIEICYSKSGGDSFTKAEKNAAELVARILKSKGWGINKVGKHQDYWQGTYYKYCPHRTLDLGWQRFLNMVQAELNKLNGTSTVQPPKAETKPATSTAKPLTDGKVGDTVKVVDALYADSTGSGRSTASRGKQGKIKRIVGNRKKYLIENWGWAHANDIQLVKRATVAKPKLKGENLPNSGYYRVTATTNIRSGAGTNHRIVGTYAKGQGFNYDRKVIAGGYVWLSYVSYSGQRRYVAVV